MHHRNLSEKRMCVRKFLFFDVDRLNDYPRLDLKSKKKVYSCKISITSFDVIK